MFNFIFWLQIYLPFGTAVRARIDNQPFAGHEGGKVLDISILPSVHDKGGNSRGLCGTLNNNTRDDFHHKNETIGTINNRTEFIRSWKVLPNESLFSLQAVNARDLEPWVFPMCTCASETSNPLSCNRSVSECTPGIRTGQHSCGEVSSRRSVRSLTKRPIIPIVRRTDHYARQHRIIRVSITNWIWYYYVIRSYMPQKFVCFHFSKALFNIFAFQNISYWPVTTFIFLLRFGN
jgi:hypothetical protein